MPGKQKKPICDLCCDSLEKGQKILKCEGDCGCTVHRYCAGVTKRHFEELSNGSTPYICKWCTLKSTHAIIQQLQSEVASLKLELAEAKASANQASVQPPTHSYASAASYPLPPSGNSTNSRGKRASQHPHATQWPKVASSTAALGDNLAKSGNFGSANHTTRIQVEGARRVRNTYTHASTKSVKNAILQLCKIEGLNIERKTHTNNCTGKLN